MNCTHPDLTCINPIRGPHDLAEFECDDCGAPMIEDGDTIVEIDSAAFDDEPQYLRVHIADDHTTVLESCLTDLADDDPIAEALEQVGVEYVSLRFVGGQTLTYSKVTP